MEVTIDREAPRQKDVLRLLDRVDEERADLYPPESRHLLAVEDLELPAVMFFIARIDGELVGTGALRIDPDGYGEVKRMYVIEQARCRGVGRAILERLEHEARHEGLTSLRLETGVYQEEALKLYASAGFSIRGAFGRYRDDDPLLVFMEKILD